MKPLSPLLFALMMGVNSTAATAAECTSSFYCYGNTANSVVRVATRPPPIPPPNPRVVQQRRQAQLALRNSTPITPRIARPITTPAPQRAAPTPAPRANVRVTPPPAAPVPRANVRVTPPPAAPQPSRVTGNDCQNLTRQASTLESQAVVASKQNNRQRSISLFKAAANLRNQATRLNCR